MFNVLPVFHSFGLTGGLMMPLLGGVPVYLYPSPLHYRIVPELLYDTCATILFGTDTFLRGYARTAAPLRLAHRPPHRRGRRGREGEHAADLHGPLRRAHPRRLRRHRDGAGAGHEHAHRQQGRHGGPPLSAHARHGSSRLPAYAEGGRLFVQGPNVMLGYYRAENPGVLEPPADGWHDTGDIVAIDAQGFITIKGRAKRFAKIGGEMVSLAAVEALAAEACPGAALVVVSLPDARKGERLVLITTDPALKRETVLRHARARGAAELMVPADILLVDSLPLLGTGKPDYVAATALAKESAGSAAPRADAGASPP